VSRLALTWVTVASILIPAGLLVLPDRAMASNPASRAAVMKARARYLTVTHKRALHWHWNCKRPAGHVTWKCSVSAWRGSYRGTYDIRVRGAVARIVGEGYVRAAAAPGAVPLAKVFLKSNRDAKEACHAAELYFRMLWRCEGWWGGSCGRRSLTRPNFVWCSRPTNPDRPPDAHQYFFMSSFDGRRHLDVWRSALYYAGKNGTSAIRLVRGTTKWKSRVVSGGGQG
jgi:hypothetical protein